MGDAGMTKDLLRELARAKAVFQQRAILAAMGQLPKPADASPGADYEPCEECGGDGWIDPSYDWDDIQYPDITPRDGETQE